MTVQPQTDFAPRRFAQVPWQAIVLTVALAAVFGGQFVVGADQIGRWFNITRQHEVVIEKWTHQPAPDLEFTTLAGEPMTLSQLRGKRVVLNFWATWCAPCRHELPAFERLSNDLSGQDIIVLGLSSESAEEITSCVQQFGLTYTMGSYDSGQALAKEITAVPMTFVIDRNGVIESVHAGAMSYDELRGLVLGS